jgi:hypothetical protein
VDLLERVHGNLSNLVPDGVDPVRYQPVPPEGRRPTNKKVSP